jgi:hypothetical protein
VERSCGPMNKNRIEGEADQRERATDREAFTRWSAPMLGAPNENPPEDGRHENGQ